MEIHPADNRSVYPSYPSQVEKKGTPETVGKSPSKGGLATDKDSGKDSYEGSKKGSVGSSSKTVLQLTPGEKKQVQELKSRDREVRAHEAAHLAVAGPYATGGASFSYQKGPDGRQYAVGGEVGIDSSEVPNDPQATARKAQTIKRAANAPANPSPQDRRVAAGAAVMEATARQEVSKERAEETKEAKKSEEAGDRSPSEEASVDDSENVQPSSHDQASGDVPDPFKPPNFRGSRIGSSGAQFDGQPVVDTGKILNLFG